MEQCIFNTSERRRTLMFIFRLRETENAHYLLRQWFQIFFLSATKLGHKRNCHRKLYRDNNA